MERSRRIFNTPKTEFQQNRKVPKKTKTEVVKKYLDQHSHTAASPGAYTKTVFRRGAGEGDQERDGWRKS